MVEYWQNLTVRQRGEIDSSQGKIAYLAEPVRINSAVKGVFVVAIATSNEKQEVQEAILIIIRVTTVAVIITSILAWIFAGQILTPLRTLTQTALSISENNLERRIDVRGNDEVAQLGITFNEMLDRLQLAFVTQQQFLNDVSHELKTPIPLARSGTFRVDGGYFRRNQRNQRNHL